MAWPTYKPPGGYVHKPASGIPAGGPGAGDAKPFGPDHRVPAWKTSIGKMEAKEYRERLRERLDKVLAGYDEALNGENVALKVTVGKQIEERVFGQAKQIVETQADTRTDDEIREAIERRKRELGV